MTQPQPYPGDVAPPRAPFREVYEDMRGRAMEGRVVITSLSGRGRDVHELVGGVLEVDLPPGTYRLETMLHTVEGAPFSSISTVTVG